MSKRIQNLFPSLVGSSIEFSFKRNADNVATIEKNICLAKSRITKDVSSAFSAGDSLCIALLGELTDFYRQKSYYMAVRSSITMRRFRPKVLQWLELTPTERCEKIADLLSTKSDRELKLTITRYFFGSYPTLGMKLKSYLSKDEFMEVA